MFLVSKEAADAIRTAYLDRGEWPAVAELRRFYKIDDNAAALICARTIASWTPLPVTGCIRPSCENIRLRVARHVVRTDIRWMTGSHRH